jgi:hypothetical protein
MLAAVAPAGAGYVTNNLAVYYDARNTTINGIGRGSGLTFNDRSGRANTATLVAGSTFTNEMGSDVLLLDDALIANFGSFMTGSQGVNGDQGSLTSGLAAVTAEALIRFRRTTANKLVGIVGATGSKSGATQYRFLSLEARGTPEQNKLRFNLRLGTPVSDAWVSVDSNQAHPDDIWMHVVGVFNASDEANVLKLYLNGVQQSHEVTDTRALNPHAAGIPTAASGSDISGGSSEELQGAFAFVRIYDRGLTAVEVASNYADAVAYFPPAPELLVTNGLVLHLDASDPLNKGGRGPVWPADGSSPTTWYDTSGAGNDAAFKTSDPNWIADGGAAWNHRPVFRFDGDDAYLVGPNSSVDPLGVHGATAATIITVINPQGNTLNATTRWFGNTGATTDFFGYTHGGASDSRPSAGVGTSVSTVYAANGPANLSAATETHILASVHSRFLRVVYDNGVAGTSETADWGVATTISTPSQKGVGSFENGGLYYSPYYTGDIGEIIVYNRALTGAELNQVGVFLQNKYGIAGQFAVAPGGTVILIR